MRLILLALLLSTSLFAQMDLIPDQGKVTSQYNTFRNIFFGKRDQQGGFIPFMKDKIYKDWKDIDSDIQSAVLYSKEHDLLSSAYQNEFNRLTSGLGTTASVAEYLVDGKASFAKRKLLIENAKSSIDMLVWAYYDDVTGKEHSMWLLNALRKNPALQIRLIVDGPTSKDNHYHQELNRLMLQSGGRIKLIRWFSKDYPANGSHRKVFIVDEEKVIIGGMNVGDEYSHLNPDKKGWRDTDLYLEGEVAGRAKDIFSSIWNQQVLEHKLKHEQIVRKKFQYAPGSNNVTVINHSPGSKDVHVDYNILTAYAKLIHDAKNTIDIENAYFILNPLLGRALTEAVHRGVRVRLFTNSEESIDEPIVMAPILSSVRTMWNTGVHSFLRKGTTLHSKFMIIDDSVVLIGSDNLHPRSQRFEGEAVAVVFDKKKALELKEVFERDIKAATCIGALEDFHIKENLSSRLGSFLFPDQL